MFGLILGIPFGVNVRKTDFLMFSDSLFARMKSSTISSSLFAFVSTSCSFFPDTMIVVSSAYKVHFSVIDSARSLM